MIILNITTLFKFPDNVKYLKVNENRKYGFGFFSPPPPPPPPRMKKLLKLHAYFSIFFLLCGIYFS